MPGFMTGIKMFYDLQIRWSQKKAARLNGLAALSLVQVVLQSSSKAQF